MEVRFRPMQPSTITREVKSGRSATEDGESFLEVVESLTAADQTPEQDPDTGGSPEPPPRNLSHGAAAEPIETAEEPASNSPEESAPQHPDTSATADPEEEPLGARLDLTA